MSLKNVKKLQVPTAMVIVSAMTVLGSLFGAVITARSTSDSELAGIRTDVAVLQKSDSIQDKTLDEVKADIEYIRKVVEEQARRQGIRVEE